VKIHNRIRLLYQGLKFLKFNNPDNVRLNQQQSQENYNRIRIRISEDSIVQDQEADK
jgi:hypothetical protein